MKRTAAAILMPFCAIFLSCTGCGEGAKITYKATGWGSEVSVEFHNGLCDVEYYSSVSLPWQKSFTVEYRDGEFYGGGCSGMDFFPAYVRAKVTRGSGSVTVSIHSGGELLAEMEASGRQAEASAHYAIRFY